MSHDDRKRAIGKVVSVAADRFVVEMHAGTDNFTVVGFDDVHYVARLGSFLMIPSQSEYVVVEVVGLRERDASAPSERGDFDRAGSSKYLDVVPVGMLPMRGGPFRFGVSVFPSLYADALYALDGELDRISIDATKIFERIAKEGRKYGMFVLLASQRPSELSKTVLSQCSNFLVHRIQNPDDLSQIRQMTPFISDSVLKRLPSLPRQHALVFGTSVNLPTTFKVREASPRPRSDDTAIVELWFHEEGRTADIRLAPQSVDEAAVAGEEPIAENEVQGDDHS